jgi:hypothetical protein
MVIDNALYDDQRVQSDQENASTVLERSAA